MRYKNREDSPTTKLGFKRAKGANRTKVLHELYSGKHAKEVAKDLSISTSSVYRCKRHAQAARKASTKDLGSSAERPRRNGSSGARRLFRGRCFTSYDQVGYLTHPSKC